MHPATAPQPDAMPVLIDAQGIHKAYAGKVLMDELDLAIHDRMKLGLVGANGAGKTTLLRILLGEEEADSGIIHTHNDLRLGHLPQHDPFTEDETTAAFLSRWSDQEPWTCAALAARFGIGPELLATPIVSCSGGWRTRAKLCAVLLREPNLLILDEPTNFLDLRTQLLLSHFLASWNGAALVVSHDRAFLQRTTTHTAELSQGSLRLHPGPIEDALVAWAEDEERAQRRAANLDSKTKQLQRFVDSNRATASKASQARSKAKQIERLNQERPLIPSITAPRAKVRVPVVERRDGPAAHIESMQVGYGETVIAACPHLEIQRGERLAIMGDNGQGKTTFLRSLCGDLPLIGGSLRWTHGAEIAIYAQHVYHALGDSGSVHDYLSRIAGANATTQEVLDIAGSFLFRGDEVLKPLAVCSGGERARAVLAGILLTKATVLMLDEPTNHLDVSTVESLCEALRSYGGTVLLASHDARFVEQLCTGIIEVGDGRIQRWPGETADYCRQLNDQLTSQGSSSRAPAQATSKAGKDNAGYAKLHRSLRKQVSASERTMERIKSTGERLLKELADCTDPSHLMTLQQQYDQQQAELARAEEDWLGAQEALDQLAEQTFQ